MTNYESIVETSAVTIFENDFQNSMQILIAESVGTIMKNYSVEKKKKREIYSFEHFSFRCSRVNIDNSVLLNFIHR